MTIRSFFLVAASLLGLAGMLPGQLAGETNPAAAPGRDTVVLEADDGRILAADATGTYVFADWARYAQSDFFSRNAMRCGTPNLAGELGQAGFAGTTADCSSTFTNPAAEYDPSGGTLYTIPVVVHVLQHPNGAGFVSDALIASQIDVLNEDFRAMAGTLGANGTDVRVEFTLAGTTRSTKSQWYNDSGAYWNSLAWDTTRYLNIYTNSASGNLGYAFVPSGGGVVGNVADRVVILWSAFGRNAPIGPPYNLGRTVTHEVGHYLGLYHTFDGGCVPLTGCDANGDLICDTNPESGPMGSGSCSRSTCGNADPVDNYMNYSDDVCMEQFTPIQANRMRCTLDNFRFDLVGSGPSLPGPAGSPSPADGATGVSTAATLSWIAGTDADSYDVYFGTDATPDAGEFLGNTSGTTFDPGPLAEGTTYSWRIDSVNAAGTTTGDVWSFTTTSGGGSGIVLSAVGYKVKGRWTADLTWSGASGSSVEIWREGSLLTTTANDGAYTDATSFKGSGSLTYQVCEPGGSPCSDPATATF